MITANGIGFYLLADMNIEHISLSLKNTSSIGTTNLWYEHFHILCITSQTTENVNQNLSQKWNAHINVYVQHVCILENVFKTIF